MKIRAAGEFLGIKRGGAMAMRLGGIRLGVEAERKDFCMRFGVSRLTLCMRGMNGVQRNSYASRCNCWAKKNPLSTS